MNLQENIQEFKTLEEANVASEANMEAQKAAVEANKWRQAELAAEAVAEGMTQTAYGEAVGKGQRSISCYVRMWRRWGYQVHGRPLFKDGYAMVATGEEITSREWNARNSERRVPTQHADQVEMVEKLLEDPKVVKAVLAKPTVAARSVANAVREKDREQIQQMARADERLDEIKKASLSGIEGRLSTMITRISEWARALDSTRDDLRDVLPSRQTELVDSSLADLERAAAESRLALGYPSKLRVIEGGFAEEAKQLA